MKKTKIIALVLVVAMMLMGAGYAYWSDTLTINNTVSTGELNVRFTGQNTTRGGDDQVGDVSTGKSKAYWAAYVNHEGLVAGHNGPATEVSPDGKTVTTKVTNMYPGAYAQYYGTIENNGTIPAVFDNAVVSFTGKNGATLSTAEAALKSNISFAFGYIIMNSDGTRVQPNPASGDGRYYASGNLADMETRLNALLKNVRLEPTQTISLDFPSEADARAAMESIGYPYNPDMHCITYTLSKNATDITEKQELGIHITINWKQHNK